MPLKLNFVTSNTGKASTLRNKLGEGFELNQIKLDIVEPQANSVEEIVKIKASTAFSLSNEAIIVHDTSFVIPALNNFPGPYIKFILETLGISGILKLMREVEDRSCFFVGSVCFYDGKDIKIFTKQSNLCQVATEIKGILPPNAWSPLWQIVIPSWSNGLTYAQIGQEEIKTREKLVKGKSEFDLLVEYLKSLA
jgi:XTP/dITP diphosphohydrolase